MATLVDIPETDETAVHEAKREESAARSFADGRAVLSIQDLILIGVSNIKLLLLGPLAITIIAFGIACFLPVQYTSVAYLKLDQPGARAADALMRSAPLIEQVVARLGLPQEEVTQRKLQDNRRIVAAAGDFESTSKLFRLEYSDRRPRVAQQTNELFISTWMLTQSKLASEKRAALKSEIEIGNAHLKDISQQIDWIAKDLTARVASNVQGDAVSIIKSLVEKREQEVDKLSNLKVALIDSTQDVVFGAPDLPTKPSWPNKGIITILTGVLSTMGLFVFLILQGIKTGRFTHKS